MSLPALVSIYADESCLGNGKDGDNPGGAGALIEYRQPSGTVVRRDFWLSAPATTNNRMALQSVSETLRALGAKGASFRVVFTTDSRYVVDGMTQWVFGWARNEWKRKTGAIENLALWHEAIRAASDHDVAWQWVKGHNGHAQNEYVNHLATRAAADQSASNGLIESDFDAWIAAARAKRARHSDPSPFPDESSFRASAPLPVVEGRRP